MALSPEDTKIAARYNHLLELAGVDITNPLYHGAMTLHGLRVLQDPAHIAILQSRGTLGEIIQDLSRGVTLLIRELGGSKQDTIDYFLAVGAVRELRQSLEDTPDEEARAVLRKKIEES